MGDAVAGEQQRTVAAGHVHWGWGEMWEDDGAIGVLSVGVVVKSLCSKGVVVRLRDLRMEVFQFRCPETMGVAKQGSEIAMRTCSVYRRLGFRV